ncbi:MAG: hypothetical protein WD208_10255 [Dehalococcoidia bacterium]
MAGRAPVPELLRVEPTVRCQAAVDMPDGNIGRCDQEVWQYERKIWLAGAQPFYVWLCEEHLLDVAE